MKNLNKMNNTNNKDNTNDANNKSNSKYRNLRMSSSSVDYNNCSDGSNKVGKTALIKAMRK